MATAKKTTAEAENAEVQSKVDDIEEKGYIGSVPDENDNLAYSPLTGPDAPPVHPEGRFAQPSVPAPTKEG